MDNVSRKNALRNILGQSKCGFVNFGAHDEDEVKLIEEMASKWTPKKAICVETDYEEDEYYVCPSCRVEFEDQGGVYEILNSSYRYAICPYCAQHIFYEGD